MCLSNFIEFKQIEESNPLTGYRIWKNPINVNNLNLGSSVQKYTWSKLEEPHEVLDKNLGIYSYNNSDYINYYCNNNYYRNNYYLTGIIKQWGKVAIHENGYRSEYAKIDSLFCIKESDAVGSPNLIKWILIFNKKINQIAKKYECKVISWQDFHDSLNAKSANEQ